MPIFDAFIWGKLRGYAGRHAGEDCYIFGDGPSVKWFDLRQFRGKPAICCNLFPFHKEFPELDVRYCTLTTPRFFAPKALRYIRRRDYLTDGIVISDEYKKVVAAHRKVNFLFHMSNVSFIRGANVNFAFRRLPGSRGGLTASLNRFNVFDGAFYSTLTLAYFLGFSRIYLVGFDGWTIQPARSMHWYEVGEGKFFEATNFATEFLEILKREIEIHTIALDGTSNNVTSISYEEYTGQRPAFRENHELLDEHRMRVLATYPGYKIF